MKNKKLKDSRISNLSKGKVKGIGFFEEIRLKIRGHIDGARNLPRENNDGSWASPHLEREIRSYDEFASRMWGYLQIEEEEEYARLGCLMDSIVDTKAQLEAARADLRETLSHEWNPDTFRKHGESQLTDAQVAARREDERAKRMAPLRSRVSNLQGKLIAEVGEFSALRNKIIEGNNSNRMICVRVRDHLFQRLNVYWNSVLLKHSENARMPAVPSIEVTSRAESVYMESHKVLMQRAELLSQSLSKEEKEVT